MRGPTLSFILCIGLLAGAPVALGQDGDSPRDSSPVVGGIDRLSRSLDDIARSLRQLLSNQEIELVIRRVELAERRLAPLGGELQRARDDLEASKEQISQLTGVAESMRAEISDTVRAGADPLQVPQALRAELDRVESLLEREEERVENSEQRVIELENELMRGRNQIEILDELLEELLEAAKDPRP